MFWAHGLLFFYESMFLSLEKKMVWAKTVIRVLLKSSIKFLLLMNNSTFFFFFQRNQKMCPVKPNTRIIMRTLSRKDDLQVISNMSSEHAWIYQCSRTENLVLLRKSKLMCWTVIEWNTESKRWIFCVLDMIWYKYGIDYTIKSLI